MDSSTSARVALNRFNYEPPQVRPLPGPLRWIRVRLFNIFMVFVFGGSFIYLLVRYLVSKPSDEASWKSYFDEVKQVSIPVVSVAFTWWHVWLGIQMCWYPINFVGIPPFLGWQGIVPRRANIMAERSCDLMIGNLITIEEVIDRIQPDDFFAQLGQPLGDCCAAVLKKLAEKHCPQVWSMLPEDVREELRLRVMEESKSMFRPVIDDLKKNINRIFNIKQMAIDALTEDKPLLVKMFQEIGRKEFTFVLHVAAVMGFFLGLVQMTLWASFKEPWSLPLSGLIIGYFTNWLAITMIFRPVNPHHICGGYVNIQGVFLKRQQQVSAELSELICKHLIYARKMLESVMRNEECLTNVLEIYQKHMETAIDRAVGRTKVVIPLFAGRNAIRGIKDEAVKCVLDELPKHSQQVEEYMDKTFALNELIGPRLRGLPPQEFEGMLRPVFQEDEWMVLLLGGVLGVIVGTAQAIVLGR